jgi:hypothetical protein
MAVDVSIASTTPSAPPRLPTRRLSVTDRTAITVWVASRVSVFVAAAYAGWVFTGSGSTFAGSMAEQDPARTFVDSWSRWDFEGYQSIASGGYGSADFANNYAFPPGFPAVMKALAASGLSLTAAGLVVSALAGLVAAVALGRLVAGIAADGSLGVLAWVLAPSAVFLAAPYSEALFCAFAFWAWLLARRGWWVSACLLAATSVLVRVNGLFLAVALVVMFLTTRERSWRKAPALVLPWIALVGWWGYYRSLTGSWTSWFDAESTGWGRHLQTPWQTFTDTVDMAWHNYVQASFAIQYKAEVVAMIVLVSLGVVMLVMRWWAEATYVLLTCAALGTSNLYYSVPRAALVLFPVWMIIGLWMSRSRLVRVGYVSLAAPLMVIGVAAFVHGRWIA